MDGHSLVSLAKLAGVAPKKLLSWESSGYITTLLKKKGPRRLVRHFTAAEAEVVCEAARLISDGYRVSVAFKRARLTIADSTAADHPPQGPNPSTTGGV